MSTHNVPYPRQQTPGRRDYRRPPAPKSVNPWLVRLPLLGITGLTLLALLLIIMTAGYQLLHQGEIYPGVSTVFGVDIAGMDRQEAMAALTRSFTYDEDASFTFRYQDRGGQWQTRTFTAGDLGVTFDAAKTVEAAYEVGRGDFWITNLFDQLDMWRNGYAIAPVIAFNRTQAERLLTDLANSHIDQPVLDAQLSLAASGATASPSQIGRATDIDLALDALEVEIMALNTTSELTLNVAQTQPRIAEADAAAAQINRVLDAPVDFCVAPSASISQQTLTDDDLLASFPDGIVVEPHSEAGGTFCYRTTFDPARLISVDIMDDATGQANYAVALDLEAPRPLLQALAAPLAVQPVNARFIFDDDTRQIQPIANSVNGRALDVEATLAQFEAAVQAENPAQRRVNLVFQEVAPDVTENARAAELGIIELVRSQTTYYYGSTSARVHNIGVASSRFHGIIIPPGGQFSFNEWLGDVSAETGYQEGLVIVGDWTVKDVGGGVCQVATTAFQTAFYAGYPIDQRIEHAYRVSYYEQGEGAGMDATVYYPYVDLLFTNDTPYHLLIETYVNPARSTITWKFYSTKTREVLKEGPVITDQRNAGPAEYRANPEFSPGRIEHVSYASSGATVEVRRVVYEGGQVIIDEKFKSIYEPWPDQYYVAPGDPRINK